MNRRPAFSISLLLMVLLLSACSAPGKKVALPEPVVTVHDSSRPASPLNGAPVNQERPDQSRRRIQLVLTLLDEAEQAMTDKRLTTPGAYNALSFYSRVLKLQPENKEARQGLQRIVDRYIQWSDVALQQGRTGSARSYLQRAALVDPDSPALAEARQRVEVQSRLQKQQRAEKPRGGDRQPPKVAVRTGERFVALDQSGLKNRSTEVSRQLAALAELIRERDARVIIRAPSDRQGRWIYQQMNQRHEEYRIRANMQIESAAGVLLLD